MKKLRIEYASVTEKLLSSGLRPTRQRLLLGNLLFSQGCRHVTAESLQREAKAAKIEVSLATIYNTLHQFTDAKLLREVSIEGGKSYFDTNTDAHHHFLCEETGELTDIPDEHIALKNLPLPPEGMRVSSVDVVIRLRPAH
jgi:Fur family iron response transcriptional regulator